MTAEQLAEAYDDGWTCAVFATCPEGMSGEDQLLRAVKLPPADNPYRDGPRLSRLVGDRAVVAHELAIAVDGSTGGLLMWAGVVDALVQSGALCDVPADGAAAVIAAREAGIEEGVDSTWHLKRLRTMWEAAARRDALAPITALLDVPAVRAVDELGESFVAVSDLRAALAGGP